MENIMPQIAKELVKNILRRAYSEEVRNRRQIDFPFFAGYNARERGQADFVHTEKIKRKHQPF